MATFWAAVFVFGLLVLFHELGHFSVAKAAGIKVHEFSLGFGPKLVGVLRGGTAYNLRLLPLGGFVRMAGMDPEDDEAGVGEKFGDKTVLQRMAVIAAGPVMNFVLAWMLLSISLFSLGGDPVADSTFIKDLSPGLPAQQSGLRAGDQIIAIEGQKVTGWQELTSAIRQRPGWETDIVVLRDGRQLQYQLTPPTDANGHGIIGVYPVREPISPLVALTNGAKLTGRFVYGIIAYIGQMITGRAPVELGGPVRMVGEINRAVDSGVLFLLQLAAFLSVNLGLFNLFPIPALDGSRLVFLGFEGLRGRPVDPARENYIHLVGFGVLLLLVAVVTYNDILQMFIKKSSFP
ncbi:MAG: RIP metalloprotease RseP [Firmicutes bacterium]|nr:RIP metalloprotease RseP [Bacillota bacterium]